MKNLEMTKVIDFIGIKKEIRKILKRKKNNEVNLNIIEKNNVLKVYINNYLIDEVRKDKETDKKDLENIINLLIEQVKIQWVVTKNRNDISEILDNFNKKFTAQEIDENCIEDCLSCKYYSECKYKEYIRYDKSIGMPF